MASYNEIVLAVEDGLRKQKQTGVTLLDFQSRLDKFKHFNYASLSDNEIYWIITKAVFFALRVKAAKVEEKLPVLEKRFGDYKKLSTATKTDILELGRVDFHPIYITMQQLAVRCFENSCEYKQLINEHGSFQAYLIDKFGIADTSCSDSSLIKLHAALRKRFSGIGEKASWHIITELGFNAIKPDSVIIRIFTRLGLVNEGDTDNRVIQVGRDIAAELSLPIRYIDIIFVKYGQIGRSDLLGTIDGICTEINPKCDRCGLSTMCIYKGTIIVGDTTLT